MTELFYFTVEFTIMSGSKLAIGESTLAELVITSVLANNDFVTFHCLARVSRRFNRVAKSKLIKKEEITFRYKSVWTELPDGRHHGLYKMWDRGYLHGHRYQLSRIANYSHGTLHGQYQSWFDSGQISYDLNYFYGWKHGLCESWYLDGTLHYSIVYKHGIPIEL